MQSKYLGIKASLFINYFVFAILLNSVGIVMLKAQKVYGIDKVDVSILELFKDLPIAIVSFLVASFLPKIGYKKGMLAALALVSLACLGMYLGDSFLASKFLFAAVGAAFAIIKVSVYASIGLVTANQSEHNSLLSNIEGFFMFGIAFSSFLFPFFNSGVDPSAWLNVYLFLFGLCLLSFIFLLFANFESQEITKDDLEEQDFGKMFQLMVKPLVIVFSISAFLFVMMEQGIMTWLPTFNDNVLKIPENMAIMMGAILTVSIGVGRFLAGFLVKFISWFWILIFCIAMSILIILFVLPAAVNAEVETIATLSDIPIMGFIFPLIGLFLGPIYPLISSTVLSAYPKKFHAHIAGLIIIFSALGGTLGSRIIGYIFEHVDAKFAFSYAIIPMALLIIAVYFLNRLTKNVK